MKTGDCPKKSQFHRDEINRFIDIHIGLHKIPFQLANILSFAQLVGVCLQARRACTLYNTDKRQDTADKN